MTTRTINSLVLSSIAVAAALLLCACSSQGPTKPTTVSADGVWIFASSQCAFSDYQVATPPPPASGQRSLTNVLSPFLTSFIGVGIDTLASALTEAGKASTVQRNGMAGVEISLSKKPACIQVIDGRIAPKSGTSNTLADALAVSANTLPPPLDALKLADKPRWFFEAELHYSTDGKAVAVKPTRLLGAPRPTGAFGRTASSLIVFVGFSAPASLPAVDSAISDKGVATRLSFSDIHDGVDFRGDALSGSPSQIPLSAWTPLELPTAPQPMTVWINLVEVIDENEFLTMLGAALTGSKDDVKKGLSEELVPASRDQARQAAAAANQAALDAYGKAVAQAAKDRATFESAYADYCATPIGDRPTKFNALVDADAAAGGSIRAANSTARAANMPEPYDVAHQVPVIRLASDVSCQ
jgi:hypothetical protein